MHSQCSNLHKTKDDVVLPDSIDLVINEILKDKKDSLSEVYSITNIKQLLLLEIMDMISQQQMVKKCRLCNKYFIVDNLKIEYCNRIPEGEKKPCSEIGSIRSYQNKVKLNVPLKIYQRAYKTHFARVKNNRMEQSEFHIWAINAKQKLDAVRARELEIEEFEHWLKK